MTLHVLNNPEEKVTPHKVLDFDLGLTESSRWTSEWRVAWKCPVS